MEVMEKIGYKSASPISARINDNPDALSFEPFPVFFNIDHFSVSDIHSEQVDTDGFSADEFYLIADKVIPLSPFEDTDDVYFRRMLSTNNYNRIHSIVTEKASVISKTTNFLMLPSNTIRFVQVYDTVNPAVKYAVTIDPDSFAANVHVHGEPISTTHEFWESVPNRFFSFESIYMLLQQLSSYGVCVGNPDLDFLSFQPGPNGVVESHSEAVCGNLSYNKTIRHAKCHRLTHGARCSKCSHYRCTLRTKNSREKRKQTAPIKSGFSLISNSTPNSKMSKNELCEKVSALQNERYSMHAQIASLRKKLKQAIEVSSKLSASTNKDVHQLIQECGEQVKHEHTDENSFQRLFWEEQIKFNSAKKSSAMRWHPMIIKWCLQIKGRSTKAYETLRNIGFVKLPSSRTLYNYSHFMQSKCGISLDAVKHLREECRAKGMYDQDWKSYVGLLQDELKIKEDLVYDKHSGELIGFTDLDKTGNQLNELGLGLSGDNRSLAKSMLVVMVRGITTDLKYPLACYATDGISADSLYPVIYKCVRSLEVNVGLKVMFITCDGASSNRKFFAMHGTEHTNFVPNPYAPDRKLYFISDVPHLIKTCRNCFANSGSHNRTRKLWNAGKSISWMHVVDLYNDHVKEELYTHCPKLTKQHIDLDAHSKMNVSLAAQILSSNVASALEHFYGEEVSETIKFIRILDKFFDCLNTRNLNEGIRKRKPSLHPYVSPNDERLDWLEHDFLKYFKDWKDCVENRMGNYSQTEKNQMQLSQQTLLGLEMSVKSIVELVRFLLSQGVPFVLTSVFNQDPLEQQFGHCRHLGGSQENPSVYEVRHSINRLRVMGSTALALTGSNTKSLNKGRCIIDNTPLPKRARTK